MDFAQRAAQLSEAIISHRHWLHQHAELSLQEHETTAYLAGQLRELGIPVQTFEDYPGCIATIQGGKPGKTVMLRADSDALPIQENSGVDFQRQRDARLRSRLSRLHASGRRPDAVGEP